MNDKWHVDYVGTKKVVGPNQQYETPSHAQISGRWSTPWSNLVVK